MTTRPAAMSSDSMSPALSLRRAARICGVHESRLSRAIHQGELPAYRLGKRWLRIRIADLEAWLFSERHRVQPKEESRSREAAAAQDWAREKRRGQKSRPRAR